MLPILWCWKGNILNELSFLTFSQLLKIISCFIIAFSLQDKPPFNERHFLVLMCYVVPSLSQSWLTPGTKKYHGSDSVLFQRLSHRRHHHFRLPFWITCPGEASCHAGRMLKQCCGEEGNRRLPLTAIINLLVTREGHLGSSSPSPRQAFRRLQPRLTLTSNILGDPEPELPSHWLSDLQKL